MKLDNDSGLGLNDCHGKVTKNREAIISITSCITGGYGEHRIIRQKGGMSLAYFCLFYWLSVLIFTCEKSDNFCDAKSKLHGSLHGLQSL